MCKVPNTFLGYGFLIVNIFTNWAMPEPLQPVKTLLIIIQNVNTPYLGTLHYSRSIFSFYIVDKLIFHNYLFWYIFNSQQIGSVFCRDYLESVRTFLQKTFPRSTNFHIQRHAIINPFHGRWNSSCHPFRGWCIFEVVIKELCSS